MTPLNFATDQRGYNTFAMHQTDQKYGVILAQAAEQHMTAPGISDASYGNRYLVIFSIEDGSTVYIAINDTAAAFTGTLGAVTSEFKPTPRIINPGDTISLITTDTSAIVGISLYVIK